MNKAINSYLFSATGGKHWIRAGKLVCGEDYWPRDEESMHLEQSDPRYVTKIRICPWISVPIELQQNDLLLGKSEYGDMDILTRLNNTQWAPYCGENYGTMKNIIKLHNGVFIITSSIFASEDYTFAYFVSANDFRLLRDRFYLGETGRHEIWKVHQGSLHLELEENTTPARKTLCFGIRQDKAVSPSPPPEHRAAVIQAFWSAFRGEMQDALHKITTLLGSTVNLSVLTCHDQTLAEHVINGGSFNALKLLLQAEPRCVNCQTTILNALQTGREDMAMLIASKIDPAALNQFSLIWRMLVDDEMEVTAESEKGLDINMLCTQHCKAWLEHEERPIIPPYLRLLCSICSRIPTGKQLSNTMQQYFAQRMSDGNGLDVMQSNKAKVITELLCSQEFGTCVTQPPTLKKNRSKRQYFICQSTSHIPLNVMQNATGADIISAKDLEAGVLYSLYFKSKNSKQTSTVEKSLLRLDAILMAKNGTSSNFISLTDNGNIKSFAGNDRHDDFHFCQIFDVQAPKLGRQYQLQEGVTSWSPDSDNACSAPEFDVVKKRRQMTESSTGENDPDVLHQFEEFEASVLDALTEISQSYQSQKNEEILEAENDQCNGAPSQKGMFYVAVTRSVMRGSTYIPKLGATRRSDPMIRLKELSRNVPYPFELVYCIPTFAPFELEAEIHRHFAAHRIRERACTEFFDIDLKAIGEYLKATFSGEVIDGSVKV